MFEEVARVLAADPRIRYALVFGSRARGQERADSDLDVAIGGLSAILNLFVPLQHCLSVANHWLADTGRKVPAAYRDALLAMGDLGVLDGGLARRLAVASGLRNLITHRYAAIDWERIFATASGDLGDLERFCEAIETAATGG